MINIVMPCEQNRKDLLLNTLEAYEKLCNIEEAEFLIITRTIKNLNWIPQNIKAKLITYTHEGTDFNPSKALNIGIKNSTSEKIIITCPEVKPITNIIEQLKEENNVVCQVFDETATGDKTRSLVNTKYRSGTPSMYFLAQFLKTNLETINGWDEDFMKGYAWEDDDFGTRFIREGLTFNVRDDIQAIHQYHPRERGGGKGWSTNHLQLNYNNDNKITRPLNGLEKLK